MMVRTMAFTLVFVAFSWFMSGWGFAKADIAEDCRDFGKIEIKGKWYECKLK